MGFIKITEELLNEVFTENGDKAYQTSGSYCLDFFALVGGMRFNVDDALNLFLRAYYEDKVLAIKILFFSRDIRGGLGERNIFRYILNALSNMCPDVARKILSFVPEYGRYDDLFSALNTPLTKDVVKIIQDQLKIDIEAKNSGKPVSLLAKWMPSINTSSNETKELATLLAKELGLTKEEYRKMLSSLRKGIIIENNLREKDYSFDYAKIPGGASFKYKKAFFRNDKERYDTYLSLVNEGKAKINSGTLYPYQVIRELENKVLSYTSRNDGLTLEEIKSLDTIWNSFSKDSIDSKTIVVRDGSGSMFDYEAVSASSVATSLALLFAERLQGEFHNKFITFSSSPKLVTVEGNNIYEKFKNTLKYSDVSNTNIEKVYNLILNVYKSPSFKKEDALDRIVIISDMEFDVGVDCSKTTFESFKEKFNSLGFELPQIVFWNVRARNIHLPVTKNEHNVVLVSGASSNIIDMVTNNTLTNPYDIMIETVSKYSFLDELGIQ